MKANYATLDEYLDTLDGIKEKVAKETEGMNAQQVQGYFAAATRALQEATGRMVRVRRTRRNRLQATKQRVRR